MTENKRYSFNWERGHPNFWDNYCDLADCYLTCEDVVDLLNELATKCSKLEEENEQLKQRNDRQYNQLKQLWELIEKGDWETLTAMDKKMKEDEERLRNEWKCYE